MTNAVMASGYAQLLSSVQSQIKPLLPELGHFKSLMIAKRGEKWMTAVRKANLGNLDVVNICKGLRVYSDGVLINHMDMFVTSEGHLVVAMHRPQADDWCLMHFLSAWQMTRQLPQLVTFASTRRFATLDQDIWYQVALALRSLVARRVKLYKRSSLQVRLVLNSLNEVEFKAA